MTLDFDNDGTMKIKPCNGVEAMALRYWISQHGDNMQDMITVETNTEKHTTTHDE